jgi:hypothetical protein
VWFVSVKSVLFFNATFVLDFFLFFSERWSGIVPTKKESLGQRSVNCCGRGFADPKVTLPVKRASFYFLQTAHATETGFNLRWGTTY